MNLREATFLQKWVPTVPIGSDGPGFGKRETHKKYIYKEAMVVAAI